MGVSSCLPCHSDSSSRVEIHKVFGTIFTTVQSFSRDIYPPWVYLANTTRRAFQGRRFRQESRVDWPNVTSQPSKAPFRSEPIGRAWLTVAVVPGSFLYCLSYTAVLLTFFPFESVAVVVTVRVLPSADTTMCPERTTLPPILLDNVKV